MNNLIDKIDAYLDGTMSAEEKSAFETQMQNDASLRDQVDVQRNLRAGIDRLGMKAATASTFKKITLKNKIYKWGIATVAVTAIATATYFGMQTSLTSTEDGPEITYELPATNENGGTDWADADKNLPTQLFHINPNQDTVIETMGGMVFAIPAGAFLDAKDPVTLEIREAITPFDIMKAGLSTTSNGELLETGGMFYLNARNGETSLKINPAKPVYANVPTNEILPGMQLFDGERTPDGGINWVNPKPMEKQLIPVDIFSLNFYPPGFLEKVAELGFDANDRKVTDSIYYSYAGSKNQTEKPISWEKLHTPQDSLLIRFILLDDGDKNHKRSQEEVLELSNSIFTQVGANRDLFSSLAIQYSAQPQGWTLKKGETFCLKRNSKLPREFVDIVLEDGYFNERAFSTNEGRWIVQNMTSGGVETTILEIDPARIAAIQTAEFQNTIIATKEFEERLQRIFYKCKPEILDLYVNNLDKKMYEIDSMVYAQYHIGEFEHFYMRRDGGVSIVQPHMKDLQEFYNKKQEAVRQASKATYEKRTADQRKKDSAYFEQQNQLSAANENQQTDNFKTEFSLNLKEAYRQLGMPQYPPPPANAYYGVTVGSVGWHNVDKYVYESTQNRTTLDYTDPLSGKKAVIKYEELKINIDQANTYTQLMVYLVADRLPSFMKINPVNGAYSEKLDELMEYSLVVIAEKDGMWFSSNTPKVTPGSVNVTVQSTDETSLKNNMNSIYSGKVGSDFSAEISYMKETHLYSVRKEKEAEQARIDQEIMRVIFPCAVDRPAPPMDMPKADSSDPHRKSHP